ncbi:ABC transporter substrate-binding protein [Cohnella fermenti]|nr:extracellular solute-binding protein [Cohnella fermenti]
MSRKSWLIAGSTLLAAQMALAGCSDGTSNDKVSPSASSAASGTAGSGSGEVTQITLWHMEEPPNRVERFNEIIDQFNAANPDIKVTAQVQSWNDAYTKFPAAIQSGNGPDLLFTIPDYTTVIKQLGVVQPVDDIVKSLDEKHGFLEAAVTPYQYDDHVWAVPAYGMVQVLWYRKDLLDAAGITPPKTWDELAEAADKLTTGSQYGIALPASKSMATDQVLYSFLVTAGAKNIIDGNNLITFNSENIVKAYEMYAKLLKDSPADSNTYTWGEPQAQFNAGTAAMAIEKGQYLSTFEEESGRPSTDLGITTMPVADGGEEGSIYYSNAIMMLTDDSAKQAAIAKFFDYLYDPSNYGNFLNAEPGLFLPVTEDGAAEGSSFWSDPVIAKYKDQVQVLLDASKNGQLFGFTNGVASKIGQISGPNYLAQTLEQITSKGASAAEAVDWGQNQMENAVK